MRYRITFQGRPRGALGESSVHTDTVEAESLESAVVELYDRWEHIRVLVATGTDVRLQLRTVPTPGVLADDPDGQGARPWP